MASEISWFHLPKIPFSLQLKLILLHKDTRIKDAKHKIAKLIVHSDNNVVLAFLFHLR